MMRISHRTYSSIVDAAYLLLVTNAALAVIGLPLLVLLLTTDPSLSWPFLAVAAVPVGAGMAGVFWVFRDYREGERRLVLSFCRGLRRIAPRALALSSVVVGTVVVAAGDGVVLLSTQAGIWLAPLLGVIALLALSAGLVGLVAMCDAPNASLGRVLWVSLVIAVTRWPFTCISLAALAVQWTVFVTAPAVGIGVTSAATLYVVWAGSRHSLLAALVPAEELAEQGQSR
ncbi:MAG: ferredoxin-NADPH reductase [Protaetiibacter sp.]